MLCRQQNAVRIRTIAAMLIAVAVIQLVSIAQSCRRRSAGRARTGRCSAPSRPAARTNSGAKGAARPSDRVSRFNRQPDTLDELKSAMEGFTEFSTFTCTGEVRDSLYNRPIEDAKITILKLASPTRNRTGDGKVLKRIEAVTDAEGKFTFTLPTDHAFVPTPLSAERQRRRAIWRGVCRQTSTTVPSARNSGEPSRLCGRSRA